MTAHVENLDCSRPEHVVLAEAEGEHRLDEHEELDLVPPKADGPFVDGRPSDRVPQSVEHENRVPTDVARKLPHRSSFLAGAFNVSRASSEQARRDELD